MAFILVFFVLESLLPATFADSASPKIVVFLLPLFLWLLAEGCAFFLQPFGGNARKLLLRVLLAACVLMSQIVGLGFLYKNEWAYYGYKAMNWRTATQLSETFPRLLADGRAEGPMRYHLGLSGSRTSIESAWTAAQVAVMNEGSGIADGLTVPVVVASSDWRDAQRCSLEPLLQHLAGNRYEQSVALVEWPLFIYGFQPAPTSTPSSNGLRSLTLPRHLYGLRFQDLRLPQTAMWEGRELAVTGVWQLPDCSGAQTLTLRPDTAGKDAASLVLLSNVTDQPLPSTRTTIGEVVLTTDRQSIQFPVLLDEQTARWDGACRSGGCQPILSWHKRVALTSQAAYDGAYRDFTAHIFATEFRLAETTTIKEIVLRMIAPKGQWHIWGAYVLVAQQ